MTVEKRTAAPTDPSSPLIVRTHTPLDRSDSVNPTPRGPFAKSCHDDLDRIRLKKALLRADFRALRRSLYVSVCSNEKMLSVAEVAELTVSRLS